ncbi:MAG: hypothetical protein KBT36_04365, partial [Kurthia sp.]|nr:hypothetical protein [Candidatus Kurthia equi]
MKFEFYEELVVRLSDYKEKLCELLNHNDNRLFNQASLIQQLSYLYLESILELFYDINFLGINAFNHQMNIALDNYFMYNTDNKEWINTKIDDKIQHHLPYITAFLLEKINKIKWQQHHQTFNIDISEISEGYHHLLFSGHKIGQNTYTFYLTSIQVHSTQVNLNKRIYYNLKKSELLNIN